MTEGCEEAVGCWVPPAAAGAVDADVADGLRGDCQVTDSRVVRQAEPGDEGDADTGADEGAHEAVVTGAAGDAGPEAAGGGEGVQDAAGVAPALYPAVIGEFGQGGYVLAGQGMACGHEQPDVVVDQRDIGAGTGGSGPVTWWLAGVEVVDERQVGAAAAQGSEGVVGFGLDDGDVDGVACGGGQLGQGGGEQGFPGAGEGGDGQGLRAVGLQVAQLPCRCLQFGVYRVGGGEEEPPGVGEDDAAGAALHQRDARPALKGGDLLGDRGRSAAQLGCGPGEAASMGNFPQHQQPLHVDQQFSLCRHADSATSANWRAACRLACMGLWNTHAERTGVALAGGAVLLVGGSVAASSLLAGYPVLGGQAIRYAAAGLLLAGLARLRHQQLPRPAGREWCWLAVLAAVGLAGCSVLLIMATRAASPAGVGVVIGAAPLIITIAGPVAAGRRPPGRVLAAAGTVTAGAAISQLGSTTGAGWSLPGLLLSAGALAGVAGTSLLAAPLLPRLGALAVTIYACGLAAAQLLAAAVLVRLAGGPPVLRPLTGTELAALLYLAVAVTAVVFVAWFSAVERLGAERTGLFNGLVPIASLIAVAVIGTGTVTRMQLAGAVSVLAGVTLGLTQRAGPPADTRRPQRYPPPRQTRPGEPVLQLPEGRMVSFATGPAVSGRAATRREPNPRA